MRIGRRHPSRKSCQALSPNSTSRPLWRRFIRSCFSSSNPDPDIDRLTSPLTRHSPSASRTEPASASLDDVDSETKKRRRASYVPRHAQQDFGRTTTLLKERDAAQAKRVSVMYGMAFQPRQRVGIETDEMRRRRQHSGVL